MGILSRTNALAFFNVTGPKITAAEYTTLLEAVKQKQFKAIDGTSELSSIGWVPCASGFGSTFDSVDLNIVENHFIGTVRLDQKRIPGSVIREQMLSASKLWLQQNPSFTRVPKHTRAELRESIINKLSKQAIPVPTTIDIVWNLQENTACVLCSNLKKLDEIRDIFAETFENSRLVLQTPYDQFRQLLSEVQLQAFQQLSTTPHDADICTKLQSNTWILQDYLSWITAKMFTGDTTIPASQQHSIHFWIESGVSLLCSKLEDKQYTVRLSSFLEPFAEARAAFKQGCVPEKAKLHFNLSHNDLLYSGMLDSASGVWTGVKFPNDLELTDATDEIEETEVLILNFISHLYQFQEVTAKVFQQYVSSRLQKDSWSAIQTTLVEDEY